MREQYQQLGDRKKQLPEKPVRQKEEEQKVVDEQRVVMGEAENSGIAESLKNCHYPTQGEQTAKSYVTRFRELFKNDTHTEFNRDSSVLRRTFGNACYPKTILSENHGFVMCVEGPDGAGKSAVVDRLSNLYIPSRTKASFELQEDAPGARGSLICNTYRHPNNNPKISPTGCTVRKWLNNGNALGASSKDEISAPLFQSAMMESWAELQDHLARITALRVLSEGQPKLAEGKIFRSDLNGFWDMPEDSVTTPFTLIDRSPISCIVYGTLSGIPAIRMYKFMNSGTLSSTAMLILAPSVETVRKRISTRKDGDASLARMEEEKPGYLDAVCSAYRYLRDKQIGYIFNLKRYADAGLISAAAYKFLQTTDVIPGYIEAQNNDLNGNRLIPYLYKIPAMLSAITGETSIDATAMQILLLADMYMTVNFDLSSALKYRATKQELSKIGKIEKQKSIDLLTVPYLTFLQWMQEWVLTWPGRYEDRSYKWFKEVTDSVHMW